MCESCAGQEDDLVLVRHVVRDEGSPAVGAERTELWCFACRAEQTHEPIEEQA